MNDFIDLFTSNIKRPGSIDLLDWLTVKTDFLAAPASSKYHSCHEGGLAEHSVNVFDRLRISYEYNSETVAICGLLHDICKANFYTVSTRNVKNEQTGQWEKKPYYSVEEKFPFGHGEKSVFLIIQYMKLTMEEAVAIRFHMGYTGDYTNDKACGAAFRKYPLALELHIADMRASYLDEKEE